MRWIFREGFLLGYCFVLLPFLLNAAKLGAVFFREFWLVEVVAEDHRKIAVGGTGHGCEFETGLKCLHGLFEMFQADEGDPETQVGAGHVVHELDGGQGVVERFVVTLETLQCGRQSFVRGGIVTIDVQCLLEGTNGRFITAHAQIGLAKL